MNDRQIRLLFRALVWIIFYLRPSGMLRGPGYDQWKMLMSDLKIETETEGQHYDPTANPWP